MAKNSRWEILGTETPVSQNPPVASPSSDPRSGQFQMTGDAIRMGRGSVQSPSANPKEGSRDIMGDQTSMSRNPVKGWGNAAHLTMSDRAHQQSKTAAGGGGRKRK